MYKYLQRILFLCLITALTYSARGQVTAGLKNHMAAVTAIRERIPIEKVYLQTDKPYYTTGDTLRFKSYLLTADFLTPSNHSGMLYVELDDESGAAVKRFMIPVISGMAWGDIALDEKEISNGSYTLRAYTNWMRNFGDDYIFKKNIYVSKATGSAIMVNANFKQQNNKVESVLKFSDLNGRLLLLKDIELKVMDGKKNLSKNQLNTAIDGILKVNFDLPANNNKLFITAKDVTKGATNAKELIIPVKLNRPENTDIQFMPEGGSLVAGLKTRLGFKAINEDGKGANIAGKIINSKQQEIMAFKTSHAGMGSLDFTPQPGENYAAKIDGINKTYPLPIVNNTGITLSIQQPVGTDSLAVTLTVTADLRDNSEYYLIGQSRGVVCYGQTVSFTKGQVIKLPIARSAFPTGIARFTLIDNKHQPINDRQVFIKRNDMLNISLSPNKTTYDVRDSIALAIEVRDKDNQPVQGNFSIAITDNSQVKTDSLGTNILNNLLLTSDLKGNVEDPGYYFINSTPQKEMDLDNMLLTQGWIGYDWKEIFYPAKIQPAYPAEKEFTVTGTVTNAFGNPVNKSQVILYNKNPFILKDTLTNKEGKFAFNGLFPVDTAIFKIQAKNRNGKEFNIGVKIDEIEPAKFNAPGSIAPWYVNSDTLIIKNATAKAAQMQSIANYRGEGHMLGEVTITEKKIVKESKNLNGPGEADLVLDEEEMKKAGKMTLEALLYQKITGLHIGTFTPPKREYRETFGLFNILKHDFPHIQSISGVMKIVSKKKHTPWRMGYKLKYQEVHLIIDGMDLDYFYDDSEETIKESGGNVFAVPGDRKRYLFMKTYMDYFTAEDITGIELMTNQKYTGAYSSSFEQNKERIAPGRANEFAYIEITTRSKKGPFMQITPGSYLHKTLAFTLPKQFYSPKYTVTNKTVAMGTDMRSTLHWEPNVITDKDGKATVSFFSADKPSSYTVLIEGTDMNGSLGYKKQVINLQK